MSDKELKAQIACIIREMSVEPEEHCDRVADEIIGLLKLRPESPLVGLDEKELENLIGRLQPWTSKDIAKAICAKFGSPQKESGDLEKVLKEFDKLNWYPGVGAKTKVISYDEVKSFIASHWPKPDPRFVEVEKIELPEKLPNQEVSEYSSSWNSAIDQISQIPSDPVKFVEIDKFEMVNVIKQAGTEWYQSSDPITPLAIFLTYALSSAKDKWLKVKEVS